MVVGGLKMLRHKIWDLPRAWCEAEHPGVFSARWTTGGTGTGHKMELVFSMPTAAQGILEASGEVRKNNNNIKREC